MLRYSMQLPQSHSMSSETTKEPGKVFLTADSIVAHTLSNTSSLIFRAYLVGYGLLLFRYFSLTGRQKRSAVGLMCRSPIRESIGLFEPFLFRLPQPWYDMQCFVAFVCFVAFGYLVIFFPHVLCHLSHQGLIVKRVHW